MECEVCKYTSTGECTRCQIGRLTSAIAEARRITIDTVVPTESRNISSPGIDEWDDVCPICDMETSEPHALSACIKSRIDGEHIGAMAEVEARKLENADLLKELAEARRELGTYANAIGRVDCALGRAGDLPLSEIWEAVTAVVAERDRLRKALGAIARGEPWSAREAAAFALSPVAAAISAPKEAER
jgi:hypothetical protein